MATKSRPSHDVIFDAVGKHSFRRCRRSLKPGGIFVQGRRFRDQILEHTIDLLLVTDPLGRAAQRGGDLINPLRQKLGVGGEHRLFPDQLHLLVNPGELGVQKRQLLPTFGALRHPLFDESELTGQASAQVVADRLVRQPLAEIAHAILEPAVSRVGLIHQDLVDRLAHEQQTQVEPREPAQTAALTLEPGGNSVARLALLLEDGAATCKQRNVAPLVGLA
jgi:hypothetical protein